MGLIFLFFFCKSSQVKTAQNYWFEAYFMLCETICKVTCNYICQINVLNGKWTCIYISPFQRFNTCHIHTHIIDVEVKSIVEYFPLQCSRI